MMHLLDLKKAGATDAILENAEVLKDNNNYFLHICLMASFSPHLASSPWPDIPFYACRQVYNLALSFWKGSVSCPMMSLFCVSLFETPWRYRLKKCLAKKMIKNLILWSHCRYMLVHIKISNYFDWSFTRATERLLQCMQEICLY